MYSSISLIERGKLTRTYTSMMWMVNFHKVAKREKETTREQKKGCTRWAQKTNGENLLTNIQQQRNRIHFQSHSFPSFRVCVDFFLSRSLSNAIKSNNFIENEWMINENGKRLVKRWCWSCWVISLFHADNSIVFHWFTVLDLAFWESGESIW